MGNYTTAAEVQGFRDVSMLNISDDTINTIIDGTETLIDSKLKSKGYTYPVTGARDLPMFKLQTLQRSAAISWLGGKGQREAPAWVLQFLQQFDAWIEAIDKGDIELLDQDAEHPGRKIRMTRMRVLPKADNSLEETS